MALASISFMEEEKMDIIFSPLRLGHQMVIANQNYTQETLSEIAAQLDMFGANWVLLDAPEGRAIPEFFITGLVEAGISPIIRLALDLAKPAIINDIHAELTAYANWGVRYISFFDRPNLRSAWPSAGWTQRGLVNRFLDIFTPLAEAALSAGLNPVFPALEPGGDYWDTAFLRRALEELKAAGKDELLASLTIAAVARLNGQPIGWGAGGPENWPGAIPYHTPEDSEDHRGFRIFDWYNTISRVAIERELPIILMAEGSASEMLLMAKQVCTANEKEFSKQVTVPPNVIAINFLQMPNLASPWFEIDGTPNSDGQQWLGWKSGRREIETNNQKTKEAKAIKVKQAVATSKKDHYLLLPTYPWGKSKFHQNVIRDYAQKHQPTVGYSLSQARKAARVTVVGGSQIFTEDVIQMLADSGCVVEHITGEAHQIAEQLANS